MKKYIQFFFLFYFCISWGQVDYSNEWEDFYSYNNVKDFVKVEDEIYAIVDNAVFIYNVVTENVTKFSSVNGLSGENTTSIYYSKAFNLVIVGYENGLLEIIDKNNTITIAKDIVNFNYAGLKKINSITEYNNKLYLSTSFAVIVYDLEKLQFGDTYFIGDQSSELIINEIKIVDEFIYVATNNGISVADINNSNLIDFNNWTHYFFWNFFWN